MADTLHLQKRGETWHYYRRVPQKLIPIIGKEFIKRSLGVTKLADAKRLRAVEGVRTDALFAAAEKGQGLSDRNCGPVSLDMLIEHMRATVEELDRKSARAWAGDPPR